MCVQTVFFIPAGPSNLGMQTTLSENMEDDRERVSVAKVLSCTTYAGWAEAKTAATEYL